MMLIQLIVIETILVVVAQLLLRHGALQLQTETLGVTVVVEMVKSVWIMGGLALHGASFVLYVFILTKLRLNISVSYTHLTLPTNVSMCRGRGARDD